MAKNCKQCKENEGKRNVIVVLDRSGSMTPMSEQAVAFFNEQLDGLKTVGNAHLELVTFDTELETIRNGDVSGMEKLCAHEFVPRGMTALFDAVAKAIVSLRKKEGRKLVIVITDGGENSSTEYAGEKGRQSLKKLIADMEAKGDWTFTWLGAGIDATQFVHALGAHVGNTYNFSSTGAGYRTAGSSMRSATMDWASQEADASMDLMSGREAK